MLKARRKKATKHRGTKGNYPGWLGVFYLLVTVHVTLYDILLAYIMVASCGMMSFVR